MKSESIPEPAIQANMIFNWALQVHLHVKDHAQKLIFKMLACPVFGEG